MSISDTDFIDSMSKKQEKIQTQTAKLTSDASDTSDSRYISSSDSYNNSIDTSSPEVSASQVQKFFYDEPGSQYVSLPPHTMEQTPA
jgi:hypothetical protein